MTNPNNVNSNETQAKRQAERKVDLSILEKRFAALIQESEEGVTDLSTFWEKTLVLQGEIIMALTEMRKKAIAQEETSTHVGRIKEVVGHTL